MSKPRRIDLRAGFSLIEVLVAVSITTVLILLMGQVLGSSLSAWKTGTEQVDINTVARAVLQIIADDLASAAGDERIPFRLNTGQLAMFDDGGVSDPDAFRADEITFIGFLRTPDGSGSNQRTAQMRRYIVSPSTENDGHYDLYRHITGVASSGSNNTYADGNPLPVITGAFGALAQNIAEFRIICFDEDGNVTPNFTIGTAPAPAGSQAPAWADIHLALLSFDNARRAAAIFDAQDGDAAREFVGRNSRAYTRRVFLRNRPNP